MCVCCVGKVRTFLGREDILAGRHNLRVRLGFKVGFRSELGSRGQLE